MNYHYFSDSAFPVLVWCKAGCKESHTELSNNVETVKLNGKSYLSNALVIVAEYQKQKRMMNHERKILYNAKCTAITITGWALFWYLCGDAILKTGGV